ncbi:MAG: SMC-Scp complex subunit ScpB [Candidatus Micrarchaeota archaeon]
MPQNAEFKIENEESEEETQPPEAEEPTGDAGENDGEGLEEVDENAKAELDEAESALKPQTAVTQDSMRVVEAALFLGNKKMAYPELAILAKQTVRKTKGLVEKLADDYATRDDSAVEVAFDAEGAVMQVKPRFISSVSGLSKELELSRKGMRMLSLVAKKGKILQSELRRYFKGDIYGYMTELKELGYVSSEKSGNTRLLKPTTKFFETFQMGTVEKGAPEGNKDAATQA